jgi:hypothetical protein
MRPEASRRHETLAKKRLPRKACQGRGIPRVIGDRDAARGKPGEFAFTGKLDRVTISIAEEQALDATAAGRAEMGRQ